MNYTITNIENGQTIFDVLIEKYGTIESVFDLINANPDAFSEGMMIPLPNSLLIKNDVVHSVSEHFATIKKKINTSLTGNSNTFTYSDVKITIKDENVTAVLSFNITNKDKISQVAILIIDWGGTVQKQVLLVEPNATVTITSSFVIPKNATKTNSVKVSGSVNFTEGYTLSNWILITGKWDMEGVWFANKLWYIK